jgi:hypothetical protein
MKRKFISGAVFVLLAWAATSCEALTGCKVCQDVTYENNSVLYSSPETEFCGDELIKKEATPDLPIGNQVIKVECR